MLLKKFKIIKKRLIKKAEFIDAYIDTSNTAYGMLSIYKNPTDSEVTQAKEESNYASSIRGTISGEDSYCWAGSVLHDRLPKKATIPVKGKKVFRFACENNNQWIFDLQEFSTFEEGFNEAIKNEDKLSKFGDLNGQLDFFFASDTGKEYAKYGIGECHSDQIYFSGIKEVKEIVNNIKNNITIPEDQIHYEEDEEEDYDNLEDDWDDDY